MYVHRVVIENIRPFEHLDFEFARPGTSQADRYRGWNVIAGDNASGKSTLLRAIVLAIAGPEYVRALTARSPLKDWLKRGAEKGLIKVELCPSPEDSFAMPRGRPRILRRVQHLGGLVTLELHLERRGDEVELTGRSTREGGDPADGPWLAGLKFWFSAAYGPFRRLFGTSPDAAGMMATPNKVSRHGTLFFEDATLQQATAWLKDLKFKELEGRRGELLNQVKQLVGANFLRHGYTLDVDSGGLWLLDGNKQRTALAEMSDGYRSAVAMLVDLVWHLAHVFGDAFKTEQAGGVCSVPHPGVVFIDEVDSHLHPEWQRLIGDWLKQHLPNIQFITTSHSAFVAQAADVGGLYRLPGPGSGEAPLRIEEAERQRIIRQTPDQILRGPVFDLEATRSPLAVEERRELSQLDARRRAHSLVAGQQQRFDELERLYPED
jgi:energy-coupling factor transporter ATP-binding protein EcfA2